MPKKKKINKKKICKQQHDSSFYHNIFLYQCGKLQFWPKFSYVYWMDCLLPYNKHFNTSIYVLTSIFWVPYTWGHNQITQYSSPITSLLHYIYLFFPGRRCLQCHLECILWSPKHKPQARGNIVGSDGHIKTSIRHSFTYPSTPNSSTECWCACPNEQRTHLSRAGR